MKYDHIAALCEYGIKTGLIEEADRVYVYNRLLEQMRLDNAPQAEAFSGPLPDILAGLCDDAAERGVFEDGITARDLFDTALMGALTPFPHEVRKTFAALYEKSPQTATDWYYRFAGDTNYIRRDRIAKDRRWTYESEYGTLDITINLSKPEKDPRAIAAARLAPQSDYPKCQLCAENEGYAGRMNHPARQNHRPIPFTLCGEDWFFQYSPYVYYNEHCIVFCAEHRPMKISEDSFRRLLAFTEQFPHYFLGSNADLPIVGGSILSHDHFQGGHYTFAMERAPIETPLTFKGFPGVTGGIVRWPMSVIRLDSADPEELVRLASHILSVWRGYTDEAAVILAETDGTPHNTITPIARRRGKLFELDLVLRNNLTTPEHPLGLYHPHEELHHIKKENIGLIEVMGLAVLPARLKAELAGLEAAALSGEDIRNSASLAAHADWLDELRAKYTFTPENAAEILRQEVGAVFTRVLEHAGVYARTEDGKAAFLRFIESL